MHDVHVAFSGSGLRKPIVSLLLCLTKWHTVKWKMWAGSLRLMHRTPTWKIPLRHVTTLDCAKINVNCSTTECCRETTLCSPIRHNTGRQSFCQASLVVSGDFLNCCLMPGAIDTSVHRIGQMYWETWGFSLSSRRISALSPVMLLHESVSIPAALHAIVVVVVGDWTGSKRLPSSSPNMSHYSPSLSMVHPLYIYRMPVHANCVVQLALQSSPAPRIGPNSDLIGIQTLVNVC